MRRRLLPCVAVRLNVIVGAMLLAACNRDATAPVEAERPVVVTGAQSSIDTADAPPVSAATLTARTRTLNGCRYTYYGDLQVAAPSGGGTLALSMAGPASGCRYRMSIPFNDWLRGSGSWRLGVASLQLSAAANLSTADRSLSIRIEAETPRGIVTFQNIRITQAANPATPPTRCMYVIGEEVAEYASSGGTRSFPVTKSDARCPTPVVREGFAVPFATQYPGRFPGRFLTSLAVRAGQTFLDVTAPANQTSSVRADSYRLARDTSYRNDTSSAVVVVQRGAAAAPPPRVPPIIRISGEQQYVSIPVTSPVGTCWTWGLTSAIGMTTTWTSPVAPRTGTAYASCDAPSITVLAYFNVTGRTRRSIVWLFDGGFNSIRDFSIVQQAPVP